MSICFFCGDKQKPTFRKFTIVDIDKEPLFVRCCPECHKREEQKEVEYLLKRASGFNE